MHLPVLLVVFLLLSCNEGSQQYSFTQTSSRMKDGDGGGGATGGISEAKAKEIIEAEFKKLDEEMKQQNEKVLETINNSTSENLKVINESMKNITIVVDKMVYHMDKRISRLNDQLEENIYQTEEMSFLILQDQLEKTKEELTTVLAEIEQLKSEIGPLSGECDKFFSCFECQQSPKCGWCSMEEKCVLGDRDGPLFVSCNFYNYDYCAGKECSHYLSCSSCLSDPQCGWCYDFERLLSGCIEQPYDYQGCPAEGWFHIEGNQNQCSKRILALENVEEAPDENESWARTPPKKEKKKSKKELREEAEQYEAERQRIIAERRKQIESVTPAEKRKLLKQKQEQLSQKSNRARELKKQLKKIQARYDDMASRMRDISDEDEIEPFVEEEAVAEY